METPLLTHAVCSTCGEALNAGGSCLVCLLRGAMPETVPPESHPPSGYGDFEIVRREDSSPWELGRGAMGITYKAVDRVLHRMVALKVVQFDAGGTAGDALRERFLREARAAAALRHANVAGVFQFGASDKTGRCYFAMELVEGETLAARVRREGPLDVATALELARQVAAALVAAANRGLIHRDLKPGNLMLASGDDPAAGLEVKVVDFGLAKLAAATAGEDDLTDGGFVGTPAFASPEQAARQPVDARSDLYSLGVTLWYALTGSVPFAGRPPVEGDTHPDREHPPVGQLMARGVPRCVIALVRRLLAVSPAGRPASAKEFLSALAACRARVAAGRSWAVARRWLAVAALVLAAAGGVWWWTHVPASKDSRALGTPAVPSPEKSLAVLPFDNFSEDKDSAFFADGVQDEVLTDLAKVADLKVISRTSVMPYKDPATRSNVREIGRTLGVAYVVEGSVRRAGDRIRVNAQLIDARTDAHLWAGKYDRELRDVFAIQSEIAQAIADQLRSNLSPAEKSLIAAPPTTDLKAYELYTQARNIHVWDNPGGAEASLREKMALLEEAVRRDPGFALAYCELSKNDDDYEEMMGDDQHLQPARQAAEKALQLQPDLGEAHREMARYYRHVNEFGRALEEADIALRTLPNDAEAHRIVAEIYPYQGRCEQALQEMEKAHELDPSDYEIEFHLAQLYRTMRRYRKMEQTLLKNRPVSRLDSNWVQTLLAESKLDQGDPVAARDLMARVAPDFSPTSEICGTRFTVALYLRDYDAAEQWLDAMPQQWVNGGKPPQTWTNGMLARRRGDEEKARAILTVAREWTMDINDDDREYVHRWLQSRCDAALGRKEDAIREARQLLEKYPLAEFPTHAKTCRENLALVYALTGERARAIDELEILSKMYETISYGELRCSPYWDALRGDPRFEAVLTSLAPKP